MKKSRPLPSPSPRPTSLSSGSDSKSTEKKFYVTLLWWLKSKYEVAPTVFKHAHNQVKQISIRLQPRAIRRNLQVSVCLSVCLSVSGNDQSQIYLISVELNGAIH